jgi:hypothetical protein
MPTEEIELVEVIVELVQHTAASKAGAGGDERVVGLPKLGPKHKEQKRRVKTRRRKQSKRFGGRVGMIE